MIVVIHIIYIVCLTYSFFFNISILFNTFLKQNTEMEHQNTEPGQMFQYIAQPKQGTYLSYMLLILNPEIFRPKQNDNWCGGNLYIIRIGISTG